MDISAEVPHRRHADRAHADHIGNMGTYLYQIRNMLAWMFVVWLVSIAAAAGVGVYLGTHSGQSGSASSNCLSQGGTDPSC